MDQEIDRYFWKRSSNKITIANDYFAGNIKSKN